MGVSPTPPMTVKMRAVAIGMAVLVVLRDYGQQTHLASEHPAADPDDEDPGANREVSLDLLRNKPSGPERRQSRNQDNPARVRQRDKDPEDHRVHGTAAHANNIRSRAKSWSEEKGCLLPFARTSGTGWEGQLVPATQGRGKHNVKTEGDLGEPLNKLWLPKIVSGMAPMPRWAILALGCLTS